MTPLLWNTDEYLTEEYKPKHRNHPLDEPPHPSGIWRAVAWCIVIEAVAGMAVWGVIWGMR